MSDDTDSSDVDSGGTDTAATAAAGTPDPSDLLCGVNHQQHDRSTPVIDEKSAVKMLTEYHRFKGVLDDDEEARIVRYTVQEDTEAADTALSDIYLLKVTYQLPKEAAERSLDLLTKHLPRDPFARIFVKEAQFDVREIKFYTLIVPDMVEFVKERLPEQEAEKQLPIPKCYYPTCGNNDDHDHDDDRHDQRLLDSVGTTTAAAAETILVLEDLKAHDYRSPDFSAGLTLQQATLALEAIAKMHAISLAMRLARYKNLNERYPFLFRTDKATDSYEMLLNRGLPQLRAFLADKAAMQPVLDSMLNFGNEMKNIISALLSPARCPVALLTHTDFWCNNLLFRADGGHCIILDWQMVTCSRPTNDVALLVISSLAPPLRRASKDQLLQTYWTAFTSFAAKLRVQVESGLGYTWSDFRDDYRRSQVLAILLCIGSVDVAIGDTKAEERLIEVLKDAHADKLFTQQTISQCINS